MRVETFLEVELIADSCIKNSQLKLSKWVLRLGTEKKPRISPSCSHAGRTPYSENVPVVDTHEAGGYAEQHHPVQEE